MVNTRLMPRLARKIVEGPSTYHIVVRGNDGRNVFCENRDYRRYLSLLNRFRADYDYLIYRYALMPNHVHILMRIDGELLNDAMKRINLTYSLYHKRRFGRRGHLWQDRFWSEIITTDNYLIACGMYIELNPVRAKLVDSPADYPWTSYGRNALGKPDQITDDDQLYLDMGNTPKERQRTYGIMIDAWRTRY